MNKNKNERKTMKYRLLDDNTMKILITFVGDIQLQAAEERDHLLMDFCTDILKELINSSEIFDNDDGVIKKYMTGSNTKKPIDYFLDSDELEKLYYLFSKLEQDTRKTKRKKETKSKKPEFQKPHIDDVAEYMSLEEIEEFLKDDPELSDNERFELYYDERERIKKSKEKSYTYSGMLKKLGIAPPDNNNN
jgi:hypothetical protein